MLIMGLITIVVIGFIIWIARINGKANREEQKKLAALKKVSAYKSDIDIANDIVKKAKRYDAPMTEEERIRAWSSLYDE